MLGKKTFLKFKELLLKALNNDTSPRILARSGAIGVYIAFSPFPLFHSAMMVAARFLFNLNFPVLFVATSINNPWTMIPFFSLDYLFGYWLVHNVLGWQPVWQLSLDYIVKDSAICLVSFLVGGNLLGIIGGLLSYPIMLRAFTRYQQLKVARSQQG